jgi:hypothetical protein
MQFEGNLKMADEKKKPAGAKAGAGGDKRRLLYLKERAKELKIEMQANRKEFSALREKLGSAKKDAAGAAKDED